jgi:glycosyltransferase involved in cell wall biosynthesis
MTSSRNEGLMWVRGDIIAFLDDDVHEGWVTALRNAYQESDADAVVGRTRNLLPGEERYEPPVGRLLCDGRLTEGSPP